MASGGLAALLPANQVPVLISSSTNIFQHGNLLSTQAGMHSLDASLLLAWKMIQQIAEQRLKSCI